MRAFALPLLLAGLAASPAHAELITFDYTAVVDKTTRYVSGSGWTDAASVTVEGKEITAGYTLRGWFTIDTNTPTYDWRPERSTVEYRGSSKNIGSVTVVETGHSFVSQASSFETGFTVSNTSTGDSFGFVGDTFVNGPGWTYGAEYVIIYLSDTNGDLLASDSPPKTLDLAAAEWSRIIYGYDPLDDDGDDVNAWGTLTSLSLRPTSPVPEPSTYAMLAAGLLTVGAAARRRARR